MQMQMQKTSGFMQPLISDFLTCFSIPISFMSRRSGTHLNLNLNLKRVVLMTELDREWVVQIEEGRYFKEGWWEFCWHHKLGVGDILVFTLELQQQQQQQEQTELLFHVCVYDPCTACQRHYSLPTRITERTSSGFKTKPLKAVDEVAQLQLPPSPVQSHLPECQITLSAFNFKGSVIYLPMHFARSSGLHYRNCNITIVDGEERHWEMRLASNKSGGQLYILRRLQGWRNLLLANCLKPGDTLTLQLLKDGEKPILKCFCFPKRTLQFNSSSKRKPLEPVAEVGQLELPLSHGQSHPPCCQITLTASFFKRKILYLPKKFARSSGLCNRKCYMTIVDGEERHWEMKLNFKKCLGEGQSYILEGWKYLLLANCLKIGDTLTLQLLKDGEKPVLKCYST